MMGIEKPSEKGDTMDVPIPNKKKTVVSLVINLLMFVITTGVIISYFFIPNVIIRSKEEIFWFFTTDSNILAAIAGLVIAVYDVRILRGKANRLPRPAVVFKFAGTACLMLTMLVCLLYLAPRFGFGFIFGDTFFHVHLGAPLMAFVSLIFCEKTERISMPAACISFVPFALYGAVYYIMVTLIGEANGGWRDLYHFSDGMNILLPILLIIVLYILIVLGLRLIYNIGLPKPDVH